MNNPPSHQKYADKLMILCETDLVLQKAMNIASQLSICINSVPCDHQYTLVFDQFGTRLEWHGKQKQLPIEVNFHAGSAAHRRKYGGGKGQMIAKAVGLGSAVKPRILDATAGLGGDAFVLASLGCTMTLQERSPIAYALLEAGLEQAKEYAEQHDDSELNTILSRMTLINTNSFESLASNIDVVYLDPMFPTRKKNAAVNKNMQAFHELVGSDDDADQLLSHFTEQDISRIVVKRPRVAPALAGKLPNYALEGKSSRFDIYALKKLI